MAWETGGTRLAGETTIRRIKEFAGRLDGVDTRVLEEGLEIARLHRLVERAVEDELAGWGLTPRQVETLESLFHNADATMTPAELADEVGLTRSAMTGALDGLEKLGYTVRRAHPNDRRMVAIELTEAGREFMQQLLPQRYEAFVRIIGSLSPQQREALLNAYRKILEGLGQ